ncbi:transcriptional regulator ATRX homolog [Frieseomelitta varia]|uniref:transcriptional regulator ATRX homolog n=1 Tax=Frieseomelitta varia TaxID=561572 RepID=UPI001CB6AB27|nr:transcriptional regulator ATRX homolog [Frieseomelitta varia]XP_043506891.1 transcriptional regulator ATRX homolog [Frieseomelitta varia]XP_043506901.1 transcriptional regulator ATRX homolog [Frieseomelitta varia]
MIESDQSDKDTRDEMPLEDSDNSMDTNEHKQKRLREETSEDEKSDLPSKKLCTSIDETIFENNLEANGVAKKIKENTKDTDVDNKKDKVKSVSDESTKELCVEVSDVKNNETSINNDVAMEKKDEPNILTDGKQQGSTRMESISDLNVENAIERKTEAKEEEKEEAEADNVKSKKKDKKSQIEDAEVVEGLELSVECASDKESSSSSESESGKDKKLKSKTIIIKAKPNDSELDVSSSEADKSDSQDTPEIKPKQIAKKEKKRSRTSFSKTKNTDSEENDDVSDEDYSPKTKKKLKKTVANKKSTKSVTESKKGRGRGRKKNQVEDMDGEDENSNITEDLKSEENISDLKSVKSKSENESDSEDNSTDEKSNRTENDKKIQVLKKYIRLAGIHVKSYNDLWAGCKSNAAKVRCLKELLAKNGINGRPSIEKCKKARERNESLKDVAELNTSNIISEGRVTRAQRNKDSNKDSSKQPETPTKYREARSTFKRVLTVVDSDSE